MAYAVPANVTILNQQGGNDVQLYTSPTARFEADMAAKPSENRSRRMQVDYSLSASGPWLTETDFVNGFKSDSTTYRGEVYVGFQNGTLQPETKYFYRVYAAYTDGTVASPYSSGSFISVPQVEAPNLQAPSSESDIPVSNLTVDFSWDYSDPNAQGATLHTGSVFWWRVAASVDEPAGDWHVYVARRSGSSIVWWDEDPCFPREGFWNSYSNGLCSPVTDSEHLIATGTTLTQLTLPTTLFPQNQTIEWQVENVKQEWDTNSGLTRPEGGGAGSITLLKLHYHPGPVSNSRFFTITGPTSEPQIISPDDEEGIIASDDQVFEWEFRDPVFGTVQKTAQIRYKPVNDETWTLIDLGEFYADETYTLPANTLVPSTHYEWQVSTTNDRGEVSDWSFSGRFWAILQPGSGAVDAGEGEPIGALGCGTHRAFIYDRGGEIRRGEVTHLARIIWDRRRDDISEASIMVRDWDDDCGELLANTRCWMNELVIFRVNEDETMVRVWEGPITRITYRTDEVEVFAKDVMVYVYRRIMRQGYNDAYRLVNNVQQGLKTVVYRARKIITNALAYDDPNVIAYLTEFNFPDDARQSRVVDRYSRTAWEEVDDLAATAGLDYTTVGRRIILNDTHREIGRLPEMRDGDFGDDPIVSEYGMQMANVFAVTNNAGVYGIADRLVNGEPEFATGFIEQLASAYGEATGAAQEETLTPQALAELQQTLNDQAERNISPRHPTPVVVRVPDNTTLNPEVALGINQLVPGVWVAVRSIGTLREVVQMQKLDRVTMTEERGRETITVTLSPAPATTTDDETPPEEE
jgi:hypothetical protein